MPAIPKPRPQRLERDDQRAKTDTADEQGSREARRRANGRCEIFVVGEGRCTNRDVHTHHMIGGWKLRGRGKSALAKHKQRACVDCHKDIEGNVLKLLKDGPDPVWTDAYERVE